MTARPARKLAHRLARGDLVRHNRRTYLVGAVGLVVFYPRPAARRAGAETTTGYKVTLWPITGSGSPATVTLAATETIALAR